MLKRKRCARVGPRFDHEIQLYDNSSWKLVLSVSAPLVPSCYFQREMKEDFFAVENVYEADGG